MRHAPHTPCTTHAATPCLTPCAIRHASCHAPRLPLLLSTCQFSTRKTKKAPSPMIQSRWRKASHPQTGRDMKSSTRSRACFLVGVRVGVRVRVRVRVLPQTLSAGGDSLSLACSFAVGPGGGEGCRVSTSHDSSSDARRSTCTRGFIACSIGGLCATHETRAPPWLVPVSERPMRLWQAKTRRGG